MSQGDLIHAYMGGRLSRRTFVRRLVAGGVSFGAAVSYAHLLSQERAHAAGVPDHYGRFIAVECKIPKQDQDQVVADKRVRVRFSVSKPARVEFQISLERPPGNIHYKDLIGTKAIERIGPVERKETFVPLKVNPPHSVDAVRLQDTAPLELVVVARRDRNPKWGYASHLRTLS